MSDLTPMIGLVKPLVTENFDLVAHFNANWDKIDSEIGNIKLRDSDYSVYASSRVDDIYTVVEMKRADNTLYMRSTLSAPDANGHYTTDTWVFYDSDGLTVVKTSVWTISYDTDGNVVSTVLN